MKEKILNFIIGFSVAGILIISAKDYYLSTKQIKELPKKNNQKITPSPQINRSSPQLKPTSSPTLNPAMPCQHPYFNFKKGTTWQYQINLDTNIEANKKWQTINAFLINKIVETSNSSVIIESQFLGKKEKTYHHLFCQKDGVYGLPFPLLLSSLRKDFSFFPLVMNFPEKVILFLPPPEKLKKGEKWSTLSLKNFGLTLDNQVTAETNQIILNLGYLKTLLINSQLQFNPRISLPTTSNSSLFKFNYQLGEGVGLLNFSTKLNLEMNQIKFNLKLVNFND